MNSIDYFPEAEIDFDSLPDEILSEVLTKIFYRVK